MPKDPFPRAKEARQLLREKTKDIIDELLDTVKKAKDAGDYETAAKALQWLVEHLPSDDDGVKVIDTSVDKQQKQIDSGPKAPAIQIGIAVGGVGSKLLPKPTVEIIDADSD